MIRSIENDRLIVKICDQGAEPLSIYDKINCREILWQGNPSFWNRRAPVLFPNVGKHFNMKYSLDGNTYPSSQHGFARDMDFTCKKEEKNKLIHEIKATEKTLELYPFDFLLEISHTLKEDTLTVSWNITNPGKETMYFTIGGHPGFNVPIIEGSTYDQYSLYFPGKEELSYLLIHKPSGTIQTTPVYPLKLENGTYPLNLHLFDDDALVFDGNQFDCVGILLPDGTPYVEMTAEGFPNFGIWAAPGAPFVCLEPWMGRCDNYGYEGDLKDKENINALAPNEVFLKSYSIRVF